MRVTRLTAAVMMMALSTPAMAGGVSAATLATATPGTYVLHGGKMSEARAGQVLIEGDRLVTYSGANASLRFPGCEKKVSSTSMTTVGALCDGTASTSLVTPIGADENYGGRGHGSHVGYFVGVLALLAILGGLLAAFSGHSAPNSP